jgi:prevent-host-death family protein
MMAHKVSMQKVIAATEVRNHFGELLNRVHRGQEHVVVEKLGIPVAAIVSMQEYEQFRRWLATKLLAEVGRELGAEAQRQGLTEEQLIEKLEEDREAVYQELYGQNA